MKFCGFLSSRFQKVKSAIFLFIAHSHAHISMSVTMLLMVSGVHEMAVGRIQVAEQ